MRLLFSILASLFANPSGQRFLEFVTKISLGLQGMGTGAGVSDSGERRAVARLLTEKDNDIVVIDTGANKGQFLTMATEILTDAGKSSFTIHSFEPSKFTFGILKENCGNNQHAKLNNFGLGSTEKHSTLYADVAGSGLASQSKRDLRFIELEIAHEETIDIRSLALYCKENNIEIVDLLKIDVEGYEMDVLEGSISLIESGRIRNIMFEFGGCNIDTKTYFKDFFYFFDQRQFALYRITPNGYLAPVPAYKEIYEQFRTTNFIATPKKR